METEVIQISEGTWRIEDAGVRCFLFTGANRALLVDSGKTIDNLREIVSELTRLPVMLVNTHVDGDHIACNAQFPNLFMHPAEYSLYRKVRKRTGIIRPLWEGDIIDLGERLFEVIEVPGHTPGSIALLNEAERFLIGGDGIQNGKIYLFGEERDLLAYLHSLEKVKTRAACFDWVYPSHADFPVPAEIIEKLMEGVKRILRGEVSPTISSFVGMPIKVYDIGVATILYDMDITFA